MHEIQPPTNWNRDNQYDLYVFLGGSIEMGVAEPWQQKIVDACEKFDVTFLNPRRDDWNSSWVQSIDNPQFSEQVNWELDSIGQSDAVIFYFDPNTKSPITLMELGYVLGYLGGSRSQRVLVCCPDGYWRKGNVDIMCAREKIEVFTTIDEIIHELQMEIIERY